MSQTTSQPAAKVNLREQMPETAKWVDLRRKEWGDAHVNDCLRRAMKGEEGLFYAIEGGHVLGTPCALGTELGDWQRYALVMGCKASMFMAGPKGSEHGAH